MASFYGSIDLLKIKGARLLSGIDEKHKDMNFVCIPIVNYSGVSLQQNRDGQGYRASLPVNLWPVSEKYRQTAIANRQSRGEDITNYNPPSHQMEVSYQQDFREKAMEAAKKRILTEHPDWKDNPEHEKDLQNAVFNAVRIRLGNITAHIARQQQMTYQQPTAAPAAQGVAGYVPPQYDANGDPLGADYEGDDLPF